MLRFRIFLNFQRCPPVSIQDEQVRKSLKIIRIVFQHNASRKILLDFPYQPRLKCSFQNINPPPSP